MVKIDVHLQLKQVSLFQTTLYFFLCFLLFWSSISVQLIAWKDLSLKRPWPILRRVGRETTTHSPVPAFLCFPIALPYPCPDPGHFVCLVIKLPYYSIATEGW